VSINEEMTSVEAGLTETWLEERRESFCGLAGNERRLRCCCVEVGLDSEVRTEVRKGIAGPVVVGVAVVVVVVVLLVLSVSSSLLLLFSMVSVIHISPTWAGLCGGSAHGRSCTSGLSAQ